MLGAAELANPSAIDIFRESIEGDDLTAVAAALDALAGDHYTDEERCVAKSTLLMLCVQCHPRRVDSALDLLLSVGARPDLPVGEGERQLAGMRAGMYCQDLSPIGQAIDNGDRKTFQKLLDASLDATLDAEAGQSVPQAGLIRGGGSATYYSANALAMASACGQTEMVLSILGRLDFGSAGARRAAGDAIDVLLATGMLRQGPDSVLVDIARLISCGAELSHYAAVELADREIRLDNSTNFDWGGPWKYAPFAALAIISASPALGGDVNDVVTVLDRLQEDCGVDLQAVSLRCFPGADLLDVADLIGSRAITDRVLAAGYQRLAASRTKGVRLALSELQGEVCRFDVAVGEDKAVAVPLATHSSSAVSPPLAMPTLDGGVAGAGVTAAEIFFALREVQRAARRSSAHGAVPRP